MAVRLSVEAKNALSLAKLEAKRYNLVYIGTELLLLALVEERGSVAQQIFEGYGIDPARLRQEVEGNVLMGEQPLRPGQVIRAAPLVRRVVELAQEESERLRSEEIKNVHLMLALLCERNGVAAEVIDNLGLDRSELRERIMQVVRGGEPAVAEGIDTDLDVPSPPLLVDRDRSASYEEGMPPVAQRTESASRSSSFLDADSSDAIMTATALVLKGVCEKYASLKARGMGEAELLAFIKSLLKGQVGALLGQD